MILLRIRDFIWLFGASAIALARPSEIVKSSPEVDGQKVLFIGNSYTYYNDLPRLVANFLSARGGWTVESRAVPDATLSQHVADLETQSGTMAGATVLVLQEQSTFGVSAADPTAPVGSRLSDPSAFFAALDAIWRRANGRRIILFETWARRDWPALQAEISDRYICGAKRIGAEVAPVGDVWQALASDGTRRRLFASDGSHPSPLGSAVAAWVLARRIDPAAAATSEAAGIAPSELGRVELERIRTLLALAEARNARRRRQLTRVAGIPCEPRL